LIVEDTHIDPIIARFLANEASPEDIRLLNEWMSQDDANRRYVEQVKWLNDKAASSCQYVKVDKAKAWERVKAKTVDSVPVKPRSLPWMQSPWMRVAAIFILVLGFASLSYHFWSLSEKNTVRYNLASTDVSVNKTIGDNVQVCLNRQTTIAVTENKKKKTKELKLSGEAFIQVKHAKEELLIVKAGETQIKDIGTSFNVKARPGSPTIEVFVQTGEVIFFTADQSGIKLKQGETGIFDNQTKRFRKLVMLTPNIGAYKTYRFVFVDTPLSEAVKKINAVYSGAITIKDPLIGTNTITVTFDNERIDAMASVLSETLGLQLSKSGNGYILR
jgi:ferric-dicitrate binding protein FerR (iron transport regulator)